MIEDELIKEIYSEDGHQRIAIMRRESGTFYYDEEHFSFDSYEMCWVPGSQWQVGVYESQNALKPKPAATWIGCETKVRLLVGISREVFSQERDDLISIQPDPRFFAESVMSAGKCDLVVRDAGVTESFHRV